MCQILSSIAWYIELELDLTWLINQASSSFGLLDESFFFFLKGNFIEDKETNKQANRVPTTKQECLDSWF